MRRFGTVSASDRPPGIARSCLAQAIHGHLIDAKRIALAGLRSFNDFLGKQFCKGVTAVAEAQSVTRFLKDSRDYVDGFGVKRDLLFISESNDRHRTLPLWDYR